MGRKRKHGNPSQIHFAALPIEFPYTLDLRERAQISQQIQTLVGSFVMGLLANYKPLEIAMSIQNKPAMAGKTQQSLLTVYWRETDLDDDRVHIFRDMSFRASCLDCGQVHEEDQCPILLRAQSQDQNLEGEASNENNPL